MLHQRVRIGFRNVDVPHRLDARADRSGGAKHQQRRDDGEMRERRVNRLEDVLLDAFADDTANGRKHAGNEAELLWTEVSAAVGDLAEKDREKVSRRVDRSDQRIDQAVEFARGGRVLGHRGAHALGDGREYVAEDTGIEGAFVGKVVVNHRLVDTRAPGDAIDGRGGETVDAELGGRGGRGCACGYRARGISAEPLIN